MHHSIRDFLLPASDRIALMQAVLVLAGITVVAVLVRRDRDWLRLTVGLFLCAAGLFGLRAVH